MAIKLNGNPNVGDITVTTAEQEINLDNCFCVLLDVDFDCQISINDNQNYKKYPAGSRTPITCSSGITRLFVKTASGTANLGVWGFR